MAPAPPADGSKRAEFLIDQFQKLAEIYDGRRSDADSQATTVLTAAVTLAALIITASATLSGTSTGLAIAAMVALVISAAIAVWERSGSGLRPFDSGAQFEGKSGIAGVKRIIWNVAKWLVHDWRDTLRKLLGGHPIRADGSVDRSLLSHETRAFWKATQNLDDEAESHTCDGAHHSTMELWRARTCDLLYIARARERMAALAGIVLAVAVILIAILAVKLVEHPHGTSGKTHTTSTATAAPGTPRPVVAAVSELRSGWPSPVGS